MTVAVERSADAVEVLAKGYDPRAFVEGHEQEAGQRWARNQAKRGLAALTAAGFTISRSEVPIDRTDLIAIIEGVECAGDFAGNCADAILTLMKSRNGSAQQ